MNILEKFVSSLNETEKKKLRTHLEHPFYKDAHDHREDVRTGQLIKGYQKYDEPFTTSSWSNDEIINHALEENVDQAHYIYAAKERMDELQKRIEELEHENELLQLNEQRLILLAERERGNK